MLARHTNELFLRLERAHDVGAVEIKKSEILRWYGQERLTVNIWRDIEDKWFEITEEVPLFVGDTDDGFMFVYGLGLEARDDAWLKPIKKLTNRIDLADLK